MTDKPKNLDDQNGEDAPERDSMASDRSGEAAVASESASSQRDVGAPDEAAGGAGSGAQAEPGAASDDSSKPDSKAESEASGGAASKPDSKSASKPATSKPASGKEVTRRGFFSWAAVAWVGFTAAIGGCMTAFGRFMFPNVLYEPPNQFKVGFPEDFPKGVVDERFKESNGVFIVNNEGELYALFAICTHLGCPPAWLEAQNKFKCPCHGSGYYKSGINFEGPTPRPLERARIAISPEDGQILVDKGSKYQWELGQWEDPNSYIALG